MSNALPTLRDLCRSLGDDLTPLVPAVAPRAEVTAVHVSELADPTPFLDGGELLLTTGLGFQSSSAGAPPSVLWFGGYVQRLVRRGVSGLAVGVGPVHPAVPEGLIDAATRAGLPLLVVPAPTPFLTVSRRYWSMLAESGQRELAETLSAHRSLVAASLGTAPVPAVLRRLATATGGWAAYLAADGQPRAVWPADRLAAARELQGAVRRLNAVGAHTSASLPLGDDDVVVQPLGDGDRLLGYLAIGHARPLPPRAQQLAMTAVALLTLESVHAERLRRAGRVPDGVVLDLLRAGSVAAARRAARFLGVDLPDRGRVALLSGLGAEAMLRALDGSPGAREHVILAGRAGTGERGGAGEGSGAGEGGAAREGGAAAHSGAGEGCLLLLRDSHEAAPWLRGLVSSLPGARGALAAPADTDQVADSARRARLALAATAAGMLTDLSQDDAAGPLDTPELRAWAERRLAPLTGVGGDDLAVTLAAALRGRSEQEAARKLAVHRHTVRNRVARIQSLLRVSLDDPDARAELWLALRLTGRC
jgi:PucR family transcriptional regulator, purine catabolism regulatory protein